MECYEKKSKGDCRYHFRVDYGDLVDAAKRRANSFFRIENPNGANRCEDGGKASYHQGKEKRLHYDLQRLICGVEKVFVMRPAKAFPTIDRFGSVEAVYGQQQDGGVNK